MRGEEVGGSSGLYANCCETGKVAKRVSGRGVLTTIYLSFDLPPATYIHTRSSRNCRDMGMFNITSNRAEISLSSREELLYLLDIKSLRVPASPASS